MSLRKALVIDPFCYKQFDPSSGSIQIPYDMQAFEQEINKIYSAEKLSDGYAPFCKHLFVLNFTNAQVCTLDITPQNKHLLETSYEARTEQELPVLSRWFPKEALGDVPVAKYLDVILYSFDQVQKENESMGRQDPNSNYDWGVVSIKPQDVDFELPMQPITVMRNALGKEEGGSGIPLNREAYLRSVEYWKDKAIIR